MLGAFAFPGETSGWNGRSSSKRICHLLRWTDVISQITQWSWQVDLCFLCEPVFQLFDQRRLGLPTFLVTFCHILDHTHLALSISTNSTFFTFSLLTLKVDSSKDNYLAKMNPCVVFVMNNWTEVSQVIIMSSLHHLFNHSIYVILCNFFFTHVSELIYDLVLLRTVINFNQLSL